jgi:putative transposase
MSHTYSQIWMHFVWTPKDRVHTITRTLIPLLIDHYKARYPKGSDIYVDTTNGEPDHFHLLVGLKPSVSASKAANLIKGESSHWINSNDFIPGKFAWQDGFSVFTVSYGHVKRVRDYILNQQEHHRKVSFDEDYRRFLKAYGIDPTLKKDETE